MKKMSTFTKISLIISALKIAVDLYKLIIDRRKKNGITLKAVPIESLKDGTNSGEKIHIEHGMTIKFKKTNEDAVKEGVVDKLYAVKYNSKTYCLIIRLKGGREIRFDNPSSFELVWE